MHASTGRADYDQSVNLRTLEPGEPIFVIRGRDAVGAEAVRAWANLAAKAGAPIEAVELALQQADRLEAWPDKKKPDGPDLTEGQRKQLRYEHSRRAWDGRAVVETEAGLIVAQLVRRQFTVELQELVIALIRRLQKANLTPLQVNAAHAVLCDLAHFAGVEFKGFMEAAD
ncbi:hypothetical protein [Brevundimonas sp. A19_0]|uniref:hypothetical protein n=1 Tax=Brevundimonas sp. A19_0 TaxID=2821087 RepID=UPI001ADCA7AA|nr:hypothetical protein [Brevundimonas sp. A19_0]MBO9500798.1 hypothetical protein [Brevundimonas sp. A19_0]